MTSRNRHKYEYDVRENSAPAHVIDLVGSRKRVLEIGCGPGSITKILASDKLCRITGLERDKDALAKVTPYCESIIDADLNSDAWTDWFQGRELFDVIVAADVLEHLYDPWSTLDRMVPLLKNDGYLVVSLPHVGHGAVVSCLLNGDFQYRDWGLLDRTHIRFFCLQNIEALFAGADLKISDVRYVSKSPEETEFAESWAKLPKATRDALKQSPHSNIYQVVVKAVPTVRPGVSVSLVPPVGVGLERKVPFSTRLRNRLDERLRQKIRLVLAVLRSKF